VTFVWPPKSRNSMACPIHRFYNKNIFTYFVQIPPLKNNELHHFLPVIFEWPPKIINQKALSFAGFVIGTSLYFCAESAIK
jgi:hypothetical protein